MRTYPYSSAASAVIGLALCGFGLNGTQATLINGGFESGDLTGWHVYAPTYPVMYPLGVFQPAGEVRVIHDASAAREGQDFLALYIGNGSLTAPADMEISVYQTLRLHRGQSISGWASWWSGDSIDDWAGLSIGGHSLWSAGDYDPYVPLGPTQWDAWSWVAPEDGYYTLQLIGECRLDGELTSVAFLDGVTISDVPDAGSTLAQLAGGFALILGLSLKQAERLAQ